jgi:hypothetical protein
LVDVELEFAARCSIVPSECTTDNRDCDIWFQVEGAYLEDGKGLNNWDVFTHTHCTSSPSLPYPSALPFTLAFCSL